MGILFYTLFFVFIHSVTSRLYEQRNITWCTISKAEQAKCLDFARAVNQSFPTLKVSGTVFSVVLQCNQSLNRESCMRKLDEKPPGAHLMSLDAGEVYVAGRFHSLVPIMSEVYGQEKDSGYYSVAVVPANTQIRELLDLRDKKVCFPGVGQFAGWIMPMINLVEAKVMDVTDCNNLVKTASDFFGPSCTPNSLINKYNPIGDNPQKMCDLCAGDKRNKCTDSDPFADYDGAFRCLTKGGDIAFLKHTTVEEMTSRPYYQGPSRYDFRLLCPSGITSSIDSYRNCNWGYVPAHAVVTSSEAMPHERKMYQAFLKKAAELFGRDVTIAGDRNWGNRYNNTTSWNNNNWSSWSRTTTYPPYIPRNEWSSWNRTTTYSSWNEWNRTTTYSPWNEWNRTTTSTSYPPYQYPYGNSQYNETENRIFHLFESVSYGPNANLLLQDTTTMLYPIPENQQTFTGYLGDYANFMKRLQWCPVNSVKLCVVGEREYVKCARMRTAFRAQALKPDLVCVKGHSHIGCMSMLNDNAADLVVLDAGDIYSGGQKYNLMPIIAEYYDLKEPFYYVVAVAKQPDKDTDLLYLKGKKSCHTGIGTAAGWVIPMSFLISSERMRSYGCNSVRAASEFFSKSCVPGALSREYSRGQWGYDNLCDLCHGSSYHFCSRDAGEPFYGYTGALRCIVEGGGDIAFVKHTTIRENTAGKNPAWWSRPMMPEDFELLCRDGTRAMFYKYETCNLGKVASNALVTNKYKSNEEIQAYIQLFLYAQQFYGSKYSEDFTFKMFVSTDGYQDLIFQDATQQLRPIPSEKRNYQNYLGRDFIKSMIQVDCTASATAIRPFIVVIVAAFIFG